jgi:Ca2+-binding RTX toxin-like protein
VIYGNLGDDTLVGGSGAETIRGGQGDDVIRGGAGDDWISGDLGNDTLSGGAGSDVFHVPAGAGAGNDVILDFDATHDHVLLDPGVRFVAQQSGADTVVTLTVGLESNQLTLVGVKLNNMPSDWIGVG